jgi:hypothetical protein
VRSGRQNSTSTRSDQHRTNTKPTPNQHRTNTEPTPNQHRTNTKPTPNQHRTDTEPTPNRHRTDTEPTPNRHRTNTEPTPNRHRMLCTAYQITFVCCVTFFLSRGAQKPTRDGKTQLLPVQTNAECCIAAIFCPGRQNSTSTHSDLR